MTPEQRALWEVFLATPDAPPDAEDRFLETFSIGNSAEAADRGAELILSGRKTATSALPADFGDRPPRAGDLSILCGSADRPVAVIMTVRVWLAGLHALTPEFAANYGEWDGTLETLRLELAAHYRARDPGFSDRTPLLCEDFRVIHSA